MDTNEFFLRAGTTGILLVHGFSGSPPEMRGLGDYLFKHGYTVLGVRLAGHGTTPEDLETTTWRDWMTSAEEGLNRLTATCSRVFAVGLSMGGLICLKLSLNAPLVGVAALSTSGSIGDWRRILLPIGRHFVRWFVITGGTDPSEFSAPYTVRAYPKVPTKSIQELLRLKDQVRQIAPLIRVPVLLMHGLKDRLTSSSGVLELFALLGSYDRRVVQLKNSGHMLTLDREREEVWRIVKEFIMDTAHEHATEPLPQH